MYIKDSNEWAQETFGSCDLADIRRTKRLVKYAASQAKHPNASTYQACDGNHAAAEAIYRFLGNPLIDHHDIDEGAYQSTAKACSGCKVVLAIQDTTSVEIVNKELRKSVQQEGCPTGFLAHSSLAIDPNTEKVLGLLDQIRWLRPLREKRDPELPKIKDTRAYEEKESYKWEETDIRVEERLQSLDNVITVCDREADTYEYLAFKIDNNQRFVVRVDGDRRISSGRPLFEVMLEGKLLGQKEISIGQRGSNSGAFGKSDRPARASRKAVLEIRTGTVLVDAPRGKKSEGESLLPINFVLVLESNPPPGQEPLCWRLFTSEPVSTLEEALTVVRYYEWRWMIEEFHKCWKTGCRAEDRAFQSFDAIEKILSITSHIAVRMLQLRSLVESSPDANAGLIVTPEEQACLLAIAKEIEAKLPARAKKADATQSAVTAEEAITIIAKLGGWQKRNKDYDKPGWQALWRGWGRFQEWLLGWRAAMEYMKNMVSEDA